MEIFSETSFLTFATFFAGAAVLFSTEAGFTGAVCFSVDTCFAGAVCFAGAAGGGVSFIHPIYLQNGVQATSTTAQMQKAIIVSLSNFTILNL
jgi:hypothetical protein